MNEMWYCMLKMMLVMDCFNSNLLDCFSMHHQEHIYLRATEVSVLNWQESAEYFPNLKYCCIHKLSHTFI
jgi:hypothetical protein